MKCNYHHHFIHMTFSMMTSETGRFKFPALIKARRGAISSTISFEANESIPFIPKDRETINLLSRAVQSNMLFNHLDENEHTQIFNAMFVGVYSSGETIIRQGEKGEYFYIIEEGEVNVYVNDELINSIGEGSCFGELALIYGTPRAATIKAKNSVKFWSLFGETYRRILIDSSRKKRETYEDFLSKVPILDTFDEFERSTVADALESIQYQDGETVVKQGDLGEDFFIIVEGNGIVYQELAESSERIEIGVLGPGNYFGEIALLCNRARVATVIAQGTLKCVKMNRIRFERVLGPVRDMLKRKIPRYNSLIDLEEYPPTTDVIPLTKTTIDEH